MSALAFDESRSELSSGSWTTDLAAAEVAGYRSLIELGHGGMGSAWLAVTQGSSDFERLIVVKRLRAEWALDASAVGRFLEEARTAASIHHSNVVGIHQVGRDAEGPFLVLDYIEGATLGQLLDRNRIAGRSLPVEVVTRIALDMARGLRAIHSAVDPRGRELNILHRDVTLQNILIGLDGVTRITDFGIAKSLLASVNTNKNDLIGKLLYLPPEYLQRQPCDQRLDVYSLGLNLWIALAGGKRPWPTHSEVQLAWNICEHGVPALDSVVPGLAPELVQLVARACHRDPAQRYQSGAALVEELERLSKLLGAANHDEVAQTVQDAVGPVLERRRELVARRLSSARRSEAPAESAMAEPPVAASSTNAPRGERPMYSVAAPSPEAVTQVASFEAVTRVAPYAERASETQAQALEQPAAELTASGAPFPLAVRKATLSQADDDTLPAGPAALRRAQPTPRLLLRVLVGTLLALLFVGLGATLSSLVKRAGPTQQVQQSAP